MASFSEANLVKKLADLNASQQSIQTLSLWLIHHRKHSKTIVETWLQELKKARPNRKLTFLYLANDVVQNSKKKGPEFLRDFKLVLADGYKYTARESDDKTKGSMSRLLKIWGERAVFDSDFLKQLKQNLSSKPPAEPPKKKPKREQLSLMEEIDKIFTQEGGQTLPTDTPDADELVKALEELETSASSDAAVRERIAALPPQVSDVSLLHNLRDKGDGERLSALVEDARALLSEYNGRLTSELEERKRVAKMLRTFIMAQKDALTEAEARLQEYKTKLSKVSTVRKELKSHLQSLPDLTLLPDVTGGLAPLPSAGDLFAVDKDL